MEKPRAFKKPEAPVAEVSIGLPEINRLKDIALQLFRDETGPVNPSILWLEALHMFLTQRGAKPGFKVVRK